MRYTKRALLVFGFGLVLGFALVVGEMIRFGWIASAAMAIGLALVPLGLIADGRALALRAWLGLRPPAKKRSRPRAAAPRRKPAKRSPARAPRPTRG